MLRPRVHIEPCTNARRHVMLQAAGGRLVRIRYEPYVFGRDLAVSRGDTVFKGMAGNSTWSPDVLVEVLVLLDQAEPRVQTAVPWSPPETSPVVEHWRRRRARCPASRV